MRASVSATVIDDVDLAEPSSKFNSAAVDDMFVPPISNVVACTSPATVNIPEPAGIKVPLKEKPKGERYYFREKDLKRLFNLFPQYTDIYNIF